MKYEIPTPDLADEYKSADPIQRREIVKLAFEAEFDINRPFDVEWGEDDKYFMHDEFLYLYKPVYRSQVDQVNHVEQLVDFGLATDAKLISESPHLYQFRLH